MAVYKTVKAVAQAPYHYYSAGGGVADHTTKDEEKAVDERGNPKVEYQVLHFGDLIYQSKADFDALSEEQQENATYVPVEGYVKEHEKLGTFEKVETASSGQKKASSSNKSNAQNKSNDNDNK